MTTAEAAELLGYTTSKGNNAGRMIRYLVDTGRLRVSEDSTPNRLDISEQEVQGAIARRSRRPDDKWRYPVVVDMENR